MHTPHGAVRIRAATDSDAPAVGDLRVESLRRHPEAFGADAESHVDMSVAFWIDWLHRRADGDTSTLQVVDSGPSLIGMTGLYLGKSMKMRHNGYIWGVYVRPEWRGLDLARQLIDACVAWAVARDVRIVKLAVVTTNTAAIRCYARCGFDVYGVEPQALCYDGVCYDELLMARRLPTAATQG